MADFNKAFEILKKLEYKDCSDALHWNHGEHGWTFMGIYQVAHPDSIIWKKLNEYGTTDKEELSKLLCKDNEVINEVKRIYRQEYWNKAKLYAVDSQQIANEIFVFGVNAGIKRAIKLAQKIVGVVQDGIVGQKTLKALNAYNDKLFDIVFDAGEAEYYESLIEANRKYAIYENGWLNRAKSV